MKRLEVTVKKNQIENIQKVLKNLELSYAYSNIKIENEECGKFSSLVPDKLVDKAIEEILKGIDSRIKENTISVYNVEAHVSTYVDRISKKMIVESPPANPFERLVENAEKFTNINKDILLMALFATLIALAGLFLDNAVTVIGAMLLSPLLGPINAFAINASIGKVKKLVRIETAILILLVLLRHNKPHVLRMPLVAGTHQQMYMAADHFLQSTQLRILRNRVPLQQQGFLQHELA